MVADHLEALLGAVAEYVGDSAVVMSQQLARRGGDVPWISIEFDGDRHGDIVPHPAFLELYCYMVMAPFPTFLRLDYADPDMMEKLRVRVVEIYQWAQAHPDEKLWR